MIATCMLDIHTDWMVAGNDEQADSVRVRHVELDPGRTGLAQQGWLACVAAGKCDVPRRHLKEGGKQHPQNTACDNEAITMLPKKKPFGTLAFVRGEQGFETSET